MRICREKREEKRDRPRAATAVTAAVKRKEIWERPLLFESAYKKEERPNGEWLLLSRESRRERLPLLLSSEERDRPRAAAFALNL